MFLGVDGCPGGWFCVWTKDLKRFSYRLFPEFRQIPFADIQFKRTFIDIPIGLPDSGRRGCDYEARKLLGKRASTVFFAPVLDVLTASNYKQACEISRLKSGKMISIQSWNIVAKIREVNRLLFHHRELKNVCRESHPELCFQALFGAERIVDPKRTAPGFLNRLAALTQVSKNIERIVSQAVAQYPKIQLKRDDILDAFVLCISAASPSSYWKVIPDIPEYNSKGVKMEIVFSKSYI